MRQIHLVQLYAVIICGGVGSIQNIKHIYFSKYGHPSPLIKLYIVLFLIIELMRGNIQFLHDAHNQFLFSMIILF